MYRGGLRRKIWSEKENGMAEPQRHAAWHPPRSYSVKLLDQDTPLELLRHVRPKVLLKGADYRRDEVVGREMVEAAGGEVILVDLVPGVSTTSIVGKSRAGRAQ